jgi:hypothetical protein
MSFVCSLPEVEKDLLFLPISWRYPQVFFFFPHDFLLVEQVQLHTYYRVNLGEFILTSQNRSEEVSELCMPLLLIGDDIAKFYASLLGVAISYLHRRNPGGQFPHRSL